MKTVGNLIKEARLKKGLSKKDLENMTHIKSHFIDAIENADWERLPEFGVVTGFVKSISHFLDIPERQAVSIFRRDYPVILTNKTEQKEQKEIGKRFVWGPRLTFLFGIFIIIITVIIYLVFQYGKFNSPPSLVLYVPTDGQVVSVHTLEVSGKTDRDATVMVNNQLVVVDESGNFSTAIDVSENTKEVSVTAKSRSGKVTTVTRKIDFEL